MADIELDLTAGERCRLQQVARARGMTVEQLVADELRRRYALPARTGQVVPLHKPPATGEQR